MSPRSTGAAAVSITAVAAALLLALTGCTATHDTATPKHSASATTSEAPYEAPSATAVAALPEAKYDAVIGSLMPYYQADIPKAADETYTIAADAPLYGDDHETPVARLAAKNFLGDPTVIVPVAVSGSWVEIMTPARQALPSAAPDGAAAQSAAWIRKSLLEEHAKLTDHVVIAVKAQTVSIVGSDGKTVKEFPAGVGAGGTPTPTGVIGYVQARYLDPAQGQTVHAINLTTLHSSAADEPYGGNDGGLIGVHYESVARGAVSHGCVRLDGTAIDAINALPLGTVVQITA